MLQVQPIAGVLRTYYTSSPVHSSISQYSNPVLSEATLLLQSKSKPGRREAALERDKKEHSANENDARVEMEPRQLSQTVSRVATT